MSKFALSQKIMAESQKVFPGGVNSPVRSFSSVGGTPIVFAKGKGKYLFDVDGNRFVDFCASWGPLILGYSHPSVVKAITAQTKKAVSFGAPTELELQLAKKIQSFIPELEMLRFVSSGTEATMSVVRAARAATKREKFIKFEGCYHGHADAFLVKAGSGLSTFGIPVSAGVPEKATYDTLTVPYNDAPAVQRMFEMHGNEIAAVIIEPVAANMGLVPAKPEFIKFLRDITHKHHSVLIFDEVMTGFRLARGGASEYFDVVPDMWVFGKIMGGGLPAAAYGGKKSIMQNIAPLGGAYQAGTLSGNPLAMAAGLATLNAIEKFNVYESLENKGQILDRLVDKYLSEHIANGRVKYVRVASFFCFFFGVHAAPENYADVSKADMQTFNKIYDAWLKEGLYFGPSGYEVGFLSFAHTQGDLARCVHVIQKSLS